MFVAAGLTACVTRLLQAEAGAHAAPRIAGLTTSLPCSMLHWAYTRISVAAGWREAHPHCMAVLYGAEHQGDRGEGLRQSHAEQALAGTRSFKEACIAHLTA